MPKIKLEDFSNSSIRFRLSSSTAYILLLSDAIFFSISFWNDFLSLSDIPSF
ncbi:hypothetical protein LEP1GSC167_1019, partial [Leptospira interrogans serovar Copenhageni str. HAI0188]